MIKMVKTVKHKGYVIQQTDYNNHYMIFDEKGNMILHSSHNKALDENGLKRLIENFIELSKIIFKKEKSDD